MNPLISIITPTYNRAYILVTAIESVLAQTYQNWEMIIIDDGSTDDTRSVIKRFQDQRIRYIVQKHHNQSIARNRGLEIAQGEWIAFLDSDNELHSNFLTVITDYLATHPHVRYGFGKAKRTQELYKNGVLVKSKDDTERNYPKSLSLKDIFHRTVKFDLNGFVHHRLIRDVGIRFDPEFYKCEDWDYFFAIGDRYPEEFFFIPEVIVNYHQRFGTDGLVSNSTYRDWAIIHEMLYQKYKHSKQLIGQTWYPDRVNHWNKMADDFEKGLIPPYDLYYFQDT